MIESTFAILNILNLFLIVFIFGIGINVLMYWCLRALSSCMEKRYKWRCSDCGDILTSPTRPYCKPCSHIDNANKKMDLYNNQLISKNK